MIKQAKELQARFGIGNVRFQVGSGKDLRAYPDESMNFVFSFIVFQHIPEISIILNYVREIGRVLKKGGLFRFQVNGYRRLKFPWADNIRPTRPAFSQEELENKREVATNLRRRKSLRV